MLNLRGFLTGRLFKKRLPLKDVFGLFKGVLDSNNHALEVITDMGEKLGGDYIFDVVYVREAHSNLAAAMGTSLSGFEELTQGKYSHLGEAFRRIDALITAEIEGPVNTSASLIIPYKDISTDAAREVGGKNAVLAELKNHGTSNVPDGLAITTRAFDLFMRHNGLDAKVKETIGGADEENGLKTLRATIEAAEVPAELSIAMDAAIKEMRERQKAEFFLAVRSSSEEEDGEFSFAGQFETVLNVPASSAALEEAYKKVIASLYSPGSVAYQRRLGFDAGLMKMAVGCIIMVDAASSGVIYTASPGGDRNALLMTASWGLGVSVVEGSVDADLYTVGKPATNEELPAIRDKKAGKKDRMVSPPAGRRHRESACPGREDRHLLPNRRTGTGTREAGRQDRETSGRAAGHRMGHRKRRRNIHTTGKTPEGLGRGSREKSGAYSIARRPGADVRQGHAGTVRGRCGQGFHTEA